MRSLRSIHKDRVLEQAKRRIRSIPDPVINQICTDLKNQLGTRTSFCSFVGSRVAYIVGSDNLDPEWITPNGVALGSSFCAALVESTYARSGIVAPNTREIPILKYCPTTAVYGSWVGAPILFKGQLVGAIGVADRDPHEWEENALEIVFAAAHRVEAEINR